MARKRMIDPSIWESEDFSKLNYFARLVWIGLFSNADDEGRGRAKATYIKSTIFKYDTDEKLTKKVDAALNEIAENMAITFYLDEENEYFQLLNWTKFQRVDKPQNSQLPPLQEQSKIIRRTIGEQSANNRRQVPPSIKEENIREEKLKEESISACAPARAYGEFQNVFLTDEKFNNLNQRFTEIKVKTAIEELSRYIASTGKKYKDFYATLINWLERTIKPINSNSAINSFHNHSQHSYTAEQLNGLFDNLDDFIAPKEVQDG